MRTITDTLKDLHGTVLPNTAVTFTLPRGTYTSDAHVPPGETTVVTDTSGHYSVTLMTPASYRVSFLHYTFTVDIPDGSSPVTMEALRAAASPLTSQTQIAIDASIATHAALVASSTQLAHVKSGAGLINTSGVLSTTRIDVKAYPYLAKGDGVTDDTAAIQAALTAAGAIGNNSGSGFRHCGAEVVIPAGTYLVQPLTIPSHVSVRGDGIATVLLAKAASAGPVLSNADTSSVFISIQDLAIDGNGSNQTNNACTGINLNAVSTAESSDPYFTVKNVLVYRTKWDGVVLNGTGMALFENVIVKESFVRGFYINAPYARLTNCVAISNAFSGFMGDSGSSNCTYLNCVSAQNGNNTIITGVNGYGFYANNISRSAYIGCVARDNYNSGFSYYNCIGILTNGCIADSNGVNSANPGIGFEYILVTYSTLIGCTTLDRNTGQNQDYGIFLDTNSKYNSIAVTSFGNSTAHINTVTNVQNNRIAINASDDGYQALSYAATITPNFTNGSTVSISLNGDVAIAAPSTNVWPGMRCTFVFTQGGAGNHAMNFDGSFKVNWTPNTTAGRVNTISFVYDGTLWQQTATAVNL